MISFTDLFSAHRNFDIAEMCRCVYAICGDSQPSTVKTAITLCSPAQTHAVDIQKLEDCIEEIRDMATSVVARGGERVLHLSCHLEVRYASRRQNFAVHSFCGNVVGYDLTPRPTGAKGILRWALEKYTLFHVGLMLDFSYDLIAMCCNDLVELSSLVSRYVFGHGGRQSNRSSVYFYLGDDGEIHYRVNPPPVVVWELMKLGVPRRHVRDVILYYLAVAVAMLNPLNCYAGEPAVPIIREKSCGNSADILLEATDFDIDAGRHYGEAVLEERLCTYLNAKLK